ncbi:MAG: helix-turn-helix transcriptional regulator [Spirochaetales bacterium]|nr:helix-turn-helix transcriptional regulator [Spirochaetales bacterium]
MSGPPLAEPFAPVHHWIWLSRVRDLGSILSVLVYGIFCYIRLKQHQRQVPRFYSSRDTRKTLSWLSILIFVIIIVNSLNLILISINPADTPIFFLRFHSAYLRSFPAMLFLLYFSYFSRKQDSTENIRENEKKEKYQKQLMTKDERDSLYQRINRAMESKKFYLNPDLSLEELAKELGESKHQISQVLNSWEGKNFFTFINDYRIKEFIKSVEEDKYPNFTMLGIAMECGFRSSSSFYSLFKKAIGKTPRQYISEMKKYA